jgi:hypothetical protein
MQRKITPLLTALALVVVAAGGVAAADTSTSIGTPSNDTGDADVGICLVGADSPCNDTPDEPDTGDRIGANDSDDEHSVWIPEDRNRDGEIDDRFRGGTDREAEAGVCLVGADSPCNDGPGGDHSDERTGDGPGEERRMWIPEDRNRDGEIDHRFLGEGADVFEALFDFSTGLFAGH